jgi:hypothetical protein
MVGKEIGYYLKKKPNWQRRSNCKKAPNIKRRRYSL